MTTNNAVNVGLSGSTGTVNFVGSTSPTLVTPTIGAATAGSLTFSPTTAGIIGVTDASNAAAGNVGEYISSTVLVGSAVPLTTNMAADITSISLSAGDWDVEGNIVLSPNAAATMNIAYGTCTTSSATISFPNSGSLFAWVGSDAGGIALAFPTGKIRVDVNTTTIVYLTTQASFTSTCGAYGFIGARRIR